MSKKNHFRLKTLKNLFNLVDFIAAIVFWHISRTHEQIATKFGDATIVNKDSTIAATGWHVMETRLEDRLLCSFTPSASSHSFRSTLVCAILKRSRNCYPRNLTLSLTQSTLARLHLIARARLVKSAVGTRLRNCDSFAQMKHKPIHHSNKASGIYRIIKLSTYGQVKCHRKRHT